MYRILIYAIVLFAETRIVGGCLPLSGCTSEIYKEAIDMKETVLLLYLLFDLVKFLYKVSRETEHKPLATNKD